MRTLLILALAAALCGGPVCAEEAGTSNKADVAPVTVEGTAVIVGSLKSRHHLVTLFDTPDGRRYTVAANLTGEVLLDKVPLARLKTEHPKLHRQLTRGIAGLWAGSELPVTSIPLTTAPSLPTR